MQEDHDCGRVPECEGAEEDGDGYYTATMARDLLAATSLVPLWVESLLASCTLHPATSAGVEKMGRSPSNTKYTNL